MEITPELDPRRRYLSLPTRVVRISNPLRIREPDNLLKQGLDVCSIHTSDQPEGIILDFGTEVHGGIQILTAATGSRHSDCPQLQIRIRLGESVSEVLATPNNDHALNHIESLLPCQSRSEFGQTGFRFAHIEILEEHAMVELRHIKAVCLKHPWPYLGSFDCDDQELNNIWRTGANTVHLCCQDHIWDGIKRDRVAWSGDMHPQIPVIACAFGKQPIVADTLKFISDQTTPGRWINDIGAYSLWWIISLYEWYWYTGDINILENLHEDLKKICSTVLAHVDHQGRETMPGRRFLDWPSHGKPSDIDNALHALCVWAVRSAAVLFEAIEDYDNAQKCKLTFARMKTLALAYSTHSQTLALRVLAGLEHASNANNLLKANPCESISPWFGYYILQARSMAGDVDGCLEMLKKYWGGMLRLGASTFWEQYELDWEADALRIDELPGNGKRDIHMTCGEHCYQGHRHSLCHGWSGGPTAWLSQNILGIVPLEPGYSKIKITPRLGYLNYVKGTFPTPYGIISVSHTKDVNERVSSETDVPDRISVIQNNDHELLPHLKSCAKA